MKSTNPSKPKDLQWNNKPLSASISTTEFSELRQTQRKTMKLTNKSKPRDAQ